MMKQFPTSQLTRFLLIVAVGVTVFCANLRCSETESPPDDGRDEIEATGAATDDDGDDIAQDGVVVLRGHTAIVNWAEFTPDGRRILTESYDKTVRLWDAATGKELMVFRDHFGRNDISTAKLTPDGLRILTRPLDGTIRIWDVATGKQLAFVPQLHNFDPNIKYKLGPTYIPVAFSPDGTRIVTATSALPTSREPVARVWSAVTGRELLTLQGHEDWVTAVAFSPDSQRIITASLDKTAHVWDAATGEELAVLKGHEDQLDSAMFSPDGLRVLTTSPDKTVRLWDAATGEEIAVLRGHAGFGYDVAFSPDGLRIFTASGGRDNTAHLWDADGNEVPVPHRDGDENETWLQNTFMEVRIVAFSPDGKYLATGGVKADGADKFVHCFCLWEAATGREVAMLLVQEGENYVHAAAFSPDSTRLVTAFDGLTARIWDVATGKELAELRGHKKSVIAAAFSPDGQRIVTASADGTARVWDISSVDDQPGR